MDLLQSGKDTVLDPRDVGVFYRRPRATPTISIKADKITMTLLPILA
jgi:hypothetical protein